MPKFSRKSLVITTLVLIILTTLALGFFILQPKPSQESTTEPKLSPEQIIWNQRIESALGSSDCPKNPKPKWDDTSYQGKLIDTHFHIANIPDDPFDDYEEDEDELYSLLGVNHKISDIVCILQQEGTNKVFAFFPVFPGFEDPFLKVVNQTMEKYPDVFVPFIMPPDDDNSPDGSSTVDAKTLKKMLEIYPGLFNGYGEIGLYAREGGAPALPPDSQRLLDIYPVLRKSNLVPYFHLGEGHKDKFEKVLKANRDINFIFHGDQLVIQEEDDRQNLSQIEDILSNHTNVYYTIDELYGDVFLLRPEVSKDQFLEHFKDPDPLLAKDLATWKGFIERHPDQVIWGTDRGIVLWTLDTKVGQTLSEYARAFIGRLDPVAQEKFAYKNAERLLQE